MGPLFSLTCARTYMQGLVDFIGDKPPFLPFFLLLPFFQRKIRALIALERGFPRVSGFAAIMEFVVPIFAPESVRSFYLSAFFDVAEIFVSKLTLSYIFSLQRQIELR